MRRSFAVFFSECLLSLPVWGQTPAAPAFEVADVRINASGASDSSGDISNGRLVIRNVALRYLIAEAMMVDREDVVGPPWLDEIRVDVVAKAELRTTSDGEVRQMLLTLLRQRMKLMSHVEQRERAVWALTVWKGQPKMTASEMPARPEDADCSLKGGASGVHFACRHLTMALLALKLPHVAGQYVDKWVVDQTGLSGAWDFVLDWTPVSQLESNGGLTLFAAIQSQLGLQLENRKLPVSVVVVDSMEKAPLDN